MVNSVMALARSATPTIIPAVAKGIQAIDDFLIETSGQLFFQPCVLADLGHGARRQGAARLGHAGRPSGARSAAASG